MAVALDLPPSTYQSYEDPKRYKKPYLPVDLVRSLVPHLSSRGVPVAAVLALAGIEEGETVELPPTDNVGQVVQLGVVLPSEAALARMFEGLLLPLDLTVPVDELARTLARRLPIGLSQTAGALLPGATAPVPVRGEVPPPPATDDPASPPGPRR